MLSKEMRIGQSAFLALDDQRGSGQRQQGAYAVQRHTGVKGLGRAARRNSFLPDGKGRGGEDAPESALPQQARQYVLYGGGRLAP